MREIRYACLYCAIQDIEEKKSYLHLEPGVTGIIIFTDLDDSLLNHGDYSFTEATPSLARIKRMGLPLIMTTSKTRGEVEVLQREMDLREPFIVENGGGIYFPLGYRRFKIAGATKKPPYLLIALGKPYREIRAFVEEVKDRFGIRGFGDLSVEDIAALADLPLPAARLAKNREFTEPFLLADEAALGNLECLASPAGLKITRGGRFYHLIGASQDKGKAVEIVKDIFADHYRGPLKTVGIGDSPNDLPMLARVDVPVLIPHPDGTYDSMVLKNLIKAGHPGSRGWNEIMERLLDDSERKSP